ncbi:hypothetical protein F383_17196 [Gossypium arboreum]|uniref:Uncharacterized protein n=1 Tax=Gossypium arboreum TaxID=29729 RepID=A0A0B0MKG5_GOSAR|nr:hypothetical protein F383_17196 [Gossypium arboreum]
MNMHWMQPQQYLKMWLLSSSEV